MAVTAQDVLTRAIALSDANQAFTTLPAAEILARLNLAQRTLNARLAQEHRLFYLTTVSAPSTVGASGRTIDLAASPPFVLPVERVILLFLPSGTEVSLVDVQDQGAELAPRCYGSGTKLVEVGNDWSPASGAVTLTIWYIYKQVALNLAGDLTQTLQIPDEFAPYFDFELGIYFNGKDLGRNVADPTELQRLVAMQETAYKNLLIYVAHLHGSVQRRFALPVPVPEEKA